jgi:hypothetical protein
MAWGLASFSFSDLTTTRPFSSLLKAGEGAFLLGFLGVWDQFPGALAFPQFAVNHHARYDIVGTAP